MIYGYARVSTSGQARDGNSLAAQQAALMAAGASVIYKEAYTGTSIERPRLKELLDTLNEGDTVVVTKLDRLARNCHDGLELIDTIIEKGATLNILNLGTFDTSPMGKMTRTMFLAFAEFERDMIVQRTQEGKAIARQRPDYKEGRKRIEIDGFDEVYSAYQKGSISISEAARRLGISRRTFSRRCAEMEAA